MSTPSDPLAGPPPAEVPLAAPPLVRVVAQVRFPVIASIEHKAFIASFQEAIRKEYPILRPEQSTGVALGTRGVIHQRTLTAWRFHDTGGDWRVTLGTEFLALETGRYRSRDDFLSRLRRVLDAFVTHLDPRVVDRIGVRYIDRIEGEDLVDLPTLVRPEVSGILTTPMAAHASHAVAENSFVLPDGSGQVIARWGLLPADGTVDPGALEPIARPSWFLDVDVFQSWQDTNHPFEVEALVTQARGFTERIYSVFRWVVTDAFLRRYGGEP